jgi:uncharacterized protein (TIGR04222 family)
MLVAGTWGISGTSFVAGYGIAAVVVAIGLWVVRRGLLNSRAGTEPAGLDVYELATLNGGPQLAITAAAARLHGLGALTPSVTRCTVVAVDHSDADGSARELEQVIMDAAQPGISCSEMRAQVAPSAPIKRIVSKLQDGGLLLDEQTQSRLRRQWLWALPLLGLGVARLVSGIQSDREILFLLVIVIAVAAGTLWLAAQRVHATVAGERLLAAKRDGRTTLGRTPAQSELPLAIALFGGGALWVADPIFASALGVPYEQRSTSTGGGGGCGSGCGGGSDCGGCGGCG